MGIPVLRTTTIRTTRVAGLWAGCALPTFTFWTCLLLAVVLPVILSKLGIAFVESATELAGRFWIGLTVYTVNASLLLFLTLPREQVLAPILRRYSDWRRLLLFGTTSAVILTLYPLAIGLMLVGLSFAVFEFAERTPIPGQRTAVVTAIMVPAAYLFFGLLLEFAANAIIVSVRFEPNYDHVLRSIDKVLLFGGSVTQISHWFVTTAPAYSRALLEKVYVGMFIQKGAALVFLAVVAGRKTATHFVETVLTGYFFALVVFFLFPTHSPYFTCPTHFSLPYPEFTKLQQFQLVELSSARWHHARVALGPEYYIAFPCMHLAQPIVIAWFMRKWKGALAILVAYDIVMVLAIILLEWHYAVDLLGGVLCAAAAIYVNEKMATFRKRRLCPAEIG